MRGLATASATQERSNLWHGPRIVQITRRIFDLCECRQLQDVLRFVANSLVWQPERERRLLSHYGFIQGLDWGNIVYAITYRQLLESASSRSPHMNHARTFSNPNNCGNLIEALLAIAELAPRVYNGEKNGHDLEVQLSGQVWATEIEVQGARDYVLGVSRNPLFFNPDFLVPLAELVRLTCACVYRLPCRCLFDQLRSRTATKDELDGAVADLEAIRLGWPAAAYSRPGLVTTQSGDVAWVISPIRLYPERARQLQEMTTPDVEV